MRKKSQQVVRQGDLSCRNCTQLSASANSKKFWQELISNYNIEQGDMLPCPFCHVMRGPTGVSQLILIPESFNPFELFSFLFHSLSPLSILPLDSSPIVCSCPVLSFLVNEVHSVHSELCIHYIRFHSELLGKS